MFGLNKWKEKKNLGKREWESENKCKIKIIEY